MNFVTFHSDLPQGEKSAHPKTNLPIQNYMRMIDILFRSARLFHSEASCTLLTDQNTSVAGISGEYKRINFPIDHSALMLSRSQVQMDYVERNDFAQPLVLIDSDILFNASLSSLLGEDFDVALTWRKSATMPINGGLLILNNRRPGISKTFFRKFVSIYRGSYSEQSLWYGDQLALRDCVGLNHRDMAKSRIVLVDECRVLLLPCDVYNFSPENNYNAISSELTNKVVLHFKGQRKRLMESFWNSYLLPIGTYNLFYRLKSYLSKRQLLRSALRERDFHDGANEDGE